MFYEQLKKACKQNGTTITAVLKKIGIGAANGTYWKNGSAPSSDIVVKLSEFLGVSTDYLLKGEEDNSSIDLHDVHNSNIGAVGHNISGTINIGTDDASYENNFNAKHIDKNASISADNDEWADELLRIFKTLPLKERAKIMLDIYDIEAKYSKKK